jgi:hypothetical protein
MAVATNLGLIRSEAQRAAAPAVLALAQDRGGMRQSGSIRRLLGILLRCYKSAALLRAMPAGALALPGGGHKHEEVRAEFRAAVHVPAVSIATPPRRTTRIDAVAMYALLRALPLMWRTHASPRLRPYCEVLTQARALADVLAREPGRRHWLIIGDLSPYLIALAGAARQAGHGVIYWQYSFLDFKHMPVRADAAVILNNVGRALAAPTGASAPEAVFWRPRQTVSPLRREAGSSGQVGAVLNAHADPRALTQLSAFSREMARPIAVRLHPNSRLHDVEWPEGLTKSSANEPLEDFSRRHAFVLGGNTQAQLKVLLEGTMVVHCAGLDPLRFDHHNYVRDGILPGWRHSAEADTDALQAFFNSVDHAGAMADHIGPEPVERRPDLSDLLRRLASEPMSATRVKQRAYHG